MFPLLLLVTSMLSGSLAIPARSGPAYQTDDYYTVEGIQQYLEGLARSYGQRVTLNKIGKTYENRSLTTITITNGDQRPEKKVIFIDAGIHAREWLTHTTALNIINELVVNFEENKGLLQDYDWVILPLINADGYHYSRSGKEFKGEQIDCDPTDMSDGIMTDLMKKCWRKNRRPSSQDCIGIDLNRNFGMGWSLGKAEVNPCSNIYMGPGPFSEPESRAVQEELHRIADTGRGAMYISLHTYDDSMLIPWGYTEKKASNSRRLKEVANAGITAIGKLFHTNLVVKPSHIMYPAGGTTEDFAYSIGFPLSYTWELQGERKGVQFNFHPPREFIKELVEETWVGVRAMAEKVIHLSQGNKTALNSNVLKNIIS